MQLHSVKSSHGDVIWIIHPRQTSTCELIIFYTDENVDFNVNSNVKIYFLFCTQHTHTTVLWAFFWDHPGESVPENFLTLWCKGRLTEADTPTIQLGTTPSSLTRAQLHHTLICFTGRMPFLPPNQQHQKLKATSAFGLGRRR